MNVLVACEFTGNVRDAFRARGHNAWSCDLDECESDSQWHIKGDVRPALELAWDLVIAHPPCTYLANSGVRHLYGDVKSRNGVQAKVNGDERTRCMVDAAEFFNSFKKIKAAQVVIENPVPHTYAIALIGAYDQLIHPWMFGVPETKATCLWLKGVPKLKPTWIVPESERESGAHDVPGGPMQGKIRSRTRLGVAFAMAEQWGK